MSKLVYENATIVPNFVVEDLKCSLPPFMKQSKECKIYGTCIYPRESLGSKTHTSTFTVFNFKKKYVLKNKNKSAFDQGLLMLIEYQKKD